MSEHSGLEPSLFPVNVVSKTALTRDIYLFELASQSDEALGGFAPGSHIAVKTPSGAMRHYSLCGGAQQNVWQIAIKREGRGRGGSLSLVDGVSAGSTIWVSQPSNNFPLPADAKKLLLIAGGIGITPIMSMVQALKLNGFDLSNALKLVYLVRDAESAAFVSELKELVPATSLTIHFDLGNPADQFDLWPLFEKPSSIASATHVLCCGPQPLMDAVRDMTGHWPPKLIHFESFGVNTVSKPTDEPFSIRLASSGGELLVEPGQTILEVLRENGYKASSSCESGTCGTCRTGLLAGEADHRDFVLAEDEKTDFIMICVSRSRSPVLELDV
jgi:phthalate 4,5-dioxygenase reductase component